jgi:hypothetical protein
MKSMALAFAVASLSVIIIGCTTPHRLEVSVRDASTHQPLQGVVVHGYTPYVLKLIPPPEDVEQTNKDGNVDMLLFTDRLIQFRLYAPSRPIQQVGVGPSDISEGWSGWLSAHLVVPSEHAEPTLEVRVRQLPD